MNAVRLVRLSAIIGAFLLLGSAAEQTMAGSVIASASKVSGNATAVNLSDGGLAEGVEAFVDRTHVLVNVPAELIGADLLQVSNDDKESVPYELNVTLNQLGLLYVGLDDRLLDGDNTTPAQPLPWMLDSSMTGLPDIFYDTNVNIDIDESNDGSINQSFSLWVALAPPGTYSLLEQNNTGGRNNYIVFGSRTLVVPEPSTWLLLSFGIAGLAGLKRRRLG